MRSKFLFIAIAYSFSCLAFMACSKKKCVKCKYSYETATSYSYKEDELCDKSSKVEQFESDFKEKYDNEPGVVVCTEQ